MPDALQADSGVFTVDGNTGIPLSNGLPCPITGWIRCAEVLRAKLRDQARPLRLGLTPRRPSRDREVQVEAAAWVRQPDAPAGVRASHPRAPCSPAAMVER